jgi:ribosomal protein S1
MIMTNTITQTEFDFLFEDDSFKSRKKTKEYEAMSKLYESTIAEMPKKGQIATATYQGVRSSQIVFSVPGFKDDIRVENKPSEAKYLVDTEIGEMVDVLITDVNNNHYYIKGSIAELYESRAHQNLKSLEEGTSVTAKIVSTNPAGYDVEIIHGGVKLPGFMPNTLAGINKLYDPNSIVGETFEVMIESYAEHEKTYIVSRRKYLQSLIPEAIKDLNYENSYTGHVTGTTQFGVFVEFNECLTGMIHKANINPEWQDRLSEIKPGFQIEFYIKEVIKERGRAPKIILTQILRETLWDNIKNGQTIDGTVKDVKPFGTLVNLDEETVGLIHTSEMEKLKRKFESGQELKVKVLSVDRTSRKIFLTVA